MDSSANELRTAVSGSSMTPKRPGGQFVQRLTELEGAEFDCVIVGGGIHGACLLREAARRGQRALLVESADFGRGASARSLRILHGGLRYLQSLDLSRYRESVRARRWFLRQFPEFTEPRAFLLPLEGRGLRRASVFRIALGVDAWLSRKRNDGVVSSHHLPAGRVLGEQDLTRVASLVDASMHGGRTPFRHAAFWSDGWIAEPQRLLIEMLRWSSAFGAEVVNHTKPVRLLTASGRVSGLVLARDGEEVLVHAPLVVLSAGSWTESVLAGWGIVASQEMPTAMAFNVAVAGDAELGKVDGIRTAGIGVRARDGRNAFLWSDRGVTHVGTVHLNSRATPEETRVTRGEVESFLAAVDARLPGLGLSSRRIVSVTQGRLPSRSYDDPEMPHRDRLLSGQALGGPTGLEVVVGLKYTTAPEVAARTFERLFPGVPSRRGERPSLRGTIRVPELLDTWTHDPDAVITLAHRLRDEEAAESLADLLLGRMDGTDDPVAVETLAALLAPELYADTTVAERELANVTNALLPQRPLDR